MSFAPVYETLGDGICSCRSRPPGLTDVSRVPGQTTSTVSIPLGHACQCLRLRVFLVVSAAVATATGVTASGMTTTAVAMRAGRSAAARGAV